MDAETARLIDYSDGSYSTSDVGCAGDTIALAPRLYGAPAYLREYLNWREALLEVDDICALQTGVCWVLRPDQTLPRYGQEAGGGCPGCNGPGPTGMSGLAATVSPRKGPRQWRPVAVVTPEGAALVRDGAVLPIWQRIFYVSPPGRIVHAPPGMLYQAAVRAAQELTDRLGKPLVVGAMHNGRQIPVTYVHPGGLRRTRELARMPRGWETDVYSMDSFEVQQAYAASRGGSIMPFGM